MPLNTFLRESVRVVLPMVILGAGVAGFAAIINWRQPPGRVITDEPVPLVETVTVAAGDQNLDLQLDGVVVPFRDVSLAAEVAGRVTFKNPDCRSGRFVTRGTKLFEIDPRTYALEVQRLENELQQAAVAIQELDVDVQSTQSLLRLASEQWLLEQKQLKRIEDLFARKAVTESSLDESRRSELTVRNSRQTLQNQLEMLTTKRVRLVQLEQLARTRLEQAQINLARTEVNAPIDGIIVSDVVEQDSYVQPGAALVSIEDTSAAEVQCNLRMEELRWIWEQERNPAQPVIGSISAGAPDAEAEPHFDVLPPTPVTVTYRLGDRDYHWRGVLSRSEGTGLDEKTRTMPCRVLVSEPRAVTLEGQSGPARSGPQSLVRGMFVRIRIHARPAAPLLSIPERAVRPGQVVWVNAAGRLKIVPVRIARIFNDFALVESQEQGLQQGDRVVVSPLAVAANDMPVREAVQP